MLGQAHDLAIAKLAQKCNVGFANGPAQIAIAGQAFGLCQQIRGGLIRLKPLAQNNARLALLFLLAAAAT